jgi:thymidylate synthase ThyX
MIIAIASIRQPSTRYIKHDQDQHAVAAEAKAGQEQGHFLRRLGDGEEIAEQQRADQDGEHRGGGAGRLQQRGQDVVAR